MKRIFKCILAAFCAALMLCSLSANAAGESIKTSDVKVKKDRLFEVKIGFKSRRKITAARFNLKYNPKNIAIRQAVCSLSSAKVKYNDKNGTTDVIFLCSSGVKCSEFPTLFSIKYKKISDGDTKVTIKASDCVDYNLKNFTPPKSAVCLVKSDGASSSGGSSARSGKASASYGKSGKSGSSGGSGTGDDDVLTTSGGSKDAVSDDDVISKTFSGENNPIYLIAVPIALFVIMMLFLGLILYQNIQFRKSEKRREEEKEKQLKEKKEDSE